MRTALAALAATALLSITACSSAGDGGDAGGSSADEAMSASVAEPQPGEAMADADVPAAESATDNLARRASTVAASAPAPLARSVISTGNVALRSEDVAQALFDVGQVVDEVGGEVESEKTETDEAGEVARSRLVLRVPSARFDEAMGGLKKAADLVTSGSNSQDVSTEVLDIDIRVQVQRRSIERISLLLDRAESIRDIVSIEGQLSRRQADLASLERQQSHLADQTSMSTITVSLERTPTKSAAGGEQDDEAGFGSGLDAGWEALKDFGVGLATVVGAVLPWTLVLLVLAIPGRLVVRRLRRRPATAVPAP